MRNEETKSRELRYLANIADGIVQKLIETFAFSFISGIKIVLTSLKKVFPN